MSLEENLFDFVISWFECDAGAVHSFLDPVIGNFIYFLSSSLAGSPGSCYYNLHDGSFEAHRQRLASC